MTSELLRAPSMSHLSYGMFTDCRRRWLYRYCCDHLPLPNATIWEIKRQTKLVPWSTFPGKIVDHVISRALADFKDHGRWPTDPRQLAKDAASRWYRFSQFWLREVRSVGSRWPEDADFQPLDAHFYQTPPTPEDITEVRDKYNRCLEVFFNSPIRAQLERSDPARWKGIRKAGDPLPRFLLEGVNVYAVYDFAFEEDGLLYIVDWKTGDLNPRTETRTLDQLHWYALYAHVEWNTPIERIRLVPVWLANLGLAAPLEVNSVIVARVQERIKTRYDELRDLLHLDEGGRIEFSDWPITDKTWLCAGCQFRGVCEGAQRELKQDIPGGDDPFGNDEGTLS